MIDRVVQFPYCLTSSLENFVDIFYYRFSVLGKINSDGCRYCRNTYRRSEYDCHCFPVAHSLSP